MIFILFEAYYTAHEYKYESVNSQYDESNLAFLPTERFVHMHQFTRNIWFSALFVNSS